ncbi:MULTISPECIES: hypothetical protein [Streptomyces]|uniref:hypothetical protein n=1 Tax=Streptomyces TaxID=1883 RepID=UPI001D0B78CE|nr:MULTISPECIES: hypothetical protein [Streptomyces]MCX5081213.1 hypothetical protein [Streptomyces sp. NBC_00401]UDL99409.1 hypothetical protein LGI35_14550 [Streptomyces longhuiensis]
MAEQDRREPAGDESREPEDASAETAASGTAPPGPAQLGKEQQPGADAAAAAAAAEGAGEPVDEDAAWAAIVAGYGEEPPDPPGARPFRSIEDLALPDLDTDGSETNGSDTDGPEGSGSAPDTAKTGKSGKPATPLGSSVSFAPGVGGPRDYRPAEPSDSDADDEGHFVPPEPPPLPEADVTAKFAWLAVIGGPVLMLLAVLLGWQMTWWLTTVCVGGFLGGFGTLVMRMQGDDDDDDPGRGAVV